jgi:hypothetical protein
MGHEIKIGGVSFVVNDPHGQLARTSDAEWREEHNEAEGLEASVGTVRNRPSVPVINTVEPFASIHARTHLFDKVVNGKPGFASLALAWMVFGIPLIIFALGMGIHLYDSCLRLQGAQLWTQLLSGLALVELPIVFILGLLLRRTIRAMRDRNRQATASAS